MHHFILATKKIRQDKTDLYILNLACRKQWRSLLPIYTPSPASPHWKTPRLKWAYPRKWNNNLTVCELERKPDRKTSITALLNNKRIKRKSPSCSDQCTGPSRRQRLATTTERTIGGSASVLTHLFETGETAGKIPWQQVKSLEIKEASRFWFSNCLVARTHVLLFSSFHRRWSLEQENSFCRSQCEFISCICSLQIRGSED